MTDNMLDTFLSAIYGDLEGRVSVWWRQAPGSKSPYDQKAWFSWPEQSPAMQKFIQSLSDKDVCITTTTYSRDRRTPEFSERTNVVWMDSDVCEARHYRVPPSWTITTSPGRWQHYWQLDEPVTAQQASEISHRMAIAHEKQGADPSSWPANKIMRVPGTINTSHGAPSRVKAEVAGLLYSLHELSSAYSDIVVPDRVRVQSVPELSVDELPAYGNVTAKLSAELLELALTEPKPDQDRSRLRYKLLLELFRAGLDYEEVLSVAWHAPASRKWSEDDPRGLSGLAAEAMKASVEANTPRSEPVDPFGDNTDADVELVLDKPVVLLTEDERTVTTQNPSFVDRYVRYARERLSHENDAYDRLNGVMLLSLAYMDSGYIPRKGGVKTRLNFFGALMGDTTSGKTTSFQLLRGVCREFFASDPEYDIGGNASETALLKALHARDGRVSFFNSDEASGVLKVWVAQDWTSGMRERITELYDGEVAPILRSGKGESIMKSSEALFNVYLAGTQRGMMDYMTPELFHSGFIPRFVFAIGNPVTTDYDTYAVLQASEEETGRTFDPVARQIAAELHQSRKAVREFNKGPAGIRLSPEAARRLQDAAYALDREYKDSPQWELVRPSIFRWQVNVHKLACLFAMDRRKAEVSLEDMLHALKMGEEWFTNLLRILGRLSANASERARDEIYAFINSRGGRVTSPVLYRKFASFRGFEIEDHLKLLERQGRVAERTEDRRVYYETDSYRARGSRERKD